MPFTQQNTNPTEYIKDAVRNFQTPAPAGNARLEDFVLAENEKVVRRYQCSNIKRPRCQGYLTVTNKRIIFSGKATTSRINKEVVLDSVSGLDCYCGMNVDIGTIIWGVLLVLLGIFLMTLGDEAIFFGLLFMLVGVLLVIASFHKSFNQSVHSSKASGTPINIGEGARSLLGNGALYSLSSEPTSDTDRMLNELGALVQDLQTLGDHANRIGDIVP